MYFIGELSKRALKWPKHFSNTAAVTAPRLGHIWWQGNSAFYNLRGKLVEDAEGIVALAMR